jgi:hypothetical protein
MGTSRYASAFMCILYLMYHDLKEKAARKCPYNVPKPAIPFLLSISKKMELLPDEILC